MPDAASEERVRAVMEWARVHPAKKAPRVHRSSPKVPIAPGQLWGLLDRYTGWRYLTVEQVTESRVIVRGARNRKSTFRRDRFGYGSRFHFCGYAGPGLLPPYPTHEVGCLHAGPPLEVLPLYMPLEPGFGATAVSCNGQLEWYFMHTEKVLGHIECKVEDRPGDWRITFDGPLRGTTYQRQGPRRWVLVSITMGFA